MKLFIHGQITEEPLTCQIKSRELYPRGDGLNVRLKEFRVLGSGSFVVRPFTRQVRQDLAEPGPLLSTDSSGMTALRLDTSGFSWEITSSHPSEFAGWQVWLQPSGDRIHFTE